MATVVASSKRIDFSPTNSFVLVTVGFFRDQFERKEEEEVVAARFVN